MRKCSLFTALIIAAALFVVTTSTLFNAATLYRWVDDQGVVHVSENPPEGKMAVAQAVVGEAADKGPTAPAGEKKEFRVRPAEVTIYTTPTCPWCHKAKAWFRDKKIRYKEIDVTTDKKRARRDGAHLRPDGSSRHRRGRRGDRGLQGKPLERDLQELIHAAAFTLRKGKGAFPLLHFLLPPGEGRRRVGAPEGGFSLTWPNSAAVKIIISLYRSHQSKLIFTTHNSIPAFSIRQRHIRSTHQQTVPRHRGAGLF